LTRQVLVVAYNPAWKLEFEREATFIRRALGNMVAAVHHVGSTAIPNIYAKPIIDIMPVVADITRLDEARWQAAMTALGYEALGEFGLPGRRYFRKDNAAGIRSHHVHSYQHGHPDINRHLAFRDYLIAHPAEAQRYSALKQRLARAYPTNIEAYSNGKDAYIKEQERAAMAWRAQEQA
jgi:GrpB-like predicted nucleotidyltransferase (UPF0157 family)